MLRGNADLLDPRLARHRLDTVDQHRNLALEVVERDQQIRLEDDEEIAVVAIEIVSRAGQYAEGLDDEAEPEPLVSSEGEKRTEPCRARIARRMTIPIEREALALGLGDRRRGRMVERKHADIVAAVEED